MQRGRTDANSWLHSVSRGYEIDIEGQENRANRTGLGNEPLDAIASMGQVMLKISGSSVSGQATLQLAGRLGGEWVGELHKACSLARSEHGHVILDFADVVFVERSGAALIAHLLNEGASLINCPPFIAEQLKQFSRNDVGA